MVTGSARSPITIASFGGAAVATDTSATASSPHPIPHERRLDIRASSKECERMDRILPQGARLGNGPPRR